ncbi:MAG: exopolyphosphatase [Acidobacteriota bacterium]|nr:exopolyphosphatase [Acidobacteriota bacterium]
MSNSSNDLSVLSDDSQFPWLEGLPVDLVAGIDCGTNSIRLLIGREVDGQWIDFLRTMEIVRLGQDVDRAGRLHPDAIARTVKQAEKYAQICRSMGVTRLRFVATSATRDAENRDEFFDGIRSVIGIEPDVVEGETEATLSFTGAVGALTSIEFPALVVDIGGGSTELVIGGKDGDDISIRCIKSLNMGSVRITEKFPELGSPNPDTSRAVKWVDSLLDEGEAACDLSEIKTIVGVAGTVTTITCHALGLEEWDPEAVHASTHTLEDMAASCEYMINASTEELGALKYMPSGREDVISGGAVIWRQILRRVSAANPQLRQVTVSENDILDGIARSLL